ncbi:hypothetical protein ACMYYO_10980 [Dermacoccaceae bacterium W4C1]
MSRDVGIQMGTETGHPELDLLLSGDLLEQLFEPGHQVVRLRHKPGLSTVAAVASQDGDRWWLRVCAPAAHEKAERQQRKLQAAGVDVRSTRAAGNLLVVAAPALTDPALARKVRKAARWVTGLENAEMLRHNPFRRLVLRLPSGEQVLRVQARAERVADFTGRDFDGGLAVASPLKVIDEHLSLWPWVPGTDLSAQTAAGAEAGARAAGAALATLHRHAAPRHDAPDSSRAARATVAALGPLAQDLAARGRSVLTTLEAELEGRKHRRGCASVAQRVQVHGDFSADQVILGPTGVTLIDLDRHGSGVPEQDLGSFAAVELLRGGGLNDALAGAYRDAGGLVDRDTVRAYTAWALLSRSLEPLRRADPDWRRQGERVIALAEEVAR